MLQNAKKSAEKMVESLEMCVLMFINIERHVRNQHSLTKVSVDLPLERALQTFTQPFASLGDG